MTQHRKRTPAEAADPPPAAGSAGPLHVVWGRKWLILVGAVAGLGDGYEPPNVAQNGDTARGHQAGADGTARG